MKGTTTTALLATILFVAAGCEGGKQSTDDFITVDVTKSYPHKKELILQDFMDVEYIPLETNDDFITQGFVQDIGNEMMIVINRNDGNIFVYDRSGKALRKIDRKGQGGEEYTYITKIILDEDSNEMYVHDHHQKIIQVYDLSGIFKRKLEYKKNTNGMLYTHIENYDINNLICFDGYNKERMFVLLSKQDGSVTMKMDIPVKETKLLMKFKIDEANRNVLSMAPDPYPTIIPFGGNRILLELSSDTIYVFSRDYGLRPFLVRTPSIQSMNPEVFLILRLLSDRYFFMETIKNEYDFDAKKGFSKTYFMYDRQEKSFSGYTVYHGDYTVKKEIYMSVSTPVNREIESWQLLQAHQLVESYKKGELKGKLKKIAATLDEDSNPVIMLIKHKK